MMYGNTPAELNQLLQRDYSVNLSQFIGRGWEIANKNWGGFIGFLIVNFLIAFVLGFLPLVGSLVSLIISAPLNAGYYIVAFKLAKAQETTFGDFFKGFQNAYFLPTLLATLVIGLFAVVCILPFAIAFGVIFASQVVVNPGTLNPELLNPTSLTIPFLLLLIGLVPLIYISVVYSFAIPLIIGKKLEFWPAMELSRKLISKHWLGFLGFYLVLGLINIGGAMLCGLGLLITAPLTFCAVTAAYEAVVGLPPFDPAQVS